MIHAKKDWPQKKFGKFFFWQNFFDPIFFVGQKMTQVFFTNKSFDPKLLWPKFFWRKTFLTRIFQPKFFRAKKNVDPKNFRTKKFDLIFDFWFRIWVSGSETWDSGFRIQDLGHRICYLDSSWPTDPFDQLDVAQLSQILFLIIQVLFSIYGLLGKFELRPIMCGDKAL